MNELLIPLQQSCVQQLTHQDERGKQNWEVYNETGEVMWELPKHFTESEIFNIQDYVKKYELNAFDIGMKEMKRRMLIDIQKIQKFNELRINQMQVENTKLATALGNALGMDDEDDGQSKIGIPEHMR
ncbi:MAG: hypothetical protein DRG30_10615 [Epsilonproteobacteria bacterium]|nr:MAG: hypothetical protein DRG30_10615 [Campylobacterota bacterium]